MFEALKKSDASVDELATAFVESEALEGRLQEETERLYLNLMEIQKDFLEPGQEASKELKDARAEFQDATIRLDAVRHGQDKLKSRIAERLPIEAEQRLSDIDILYEGLDKDRDRLFKEFLKVVAKAVAIKEEIEWREFYPGPDGEYKERLPSIALDYNLMDEAQVQFLIKHIERYRAKSSVQSRAESIKGKQEDLSGEIGKLQNMMDEFKPELEVENVLNKFRPTEPEEAESQETQQQEGEKNTTSGLSYDHDVKPDYGDDNREFIDGGVGFVVTPG